MTQRASLWQFVSIPLPVMSKMSPGLTVNAQNAARRHSTTFISTSDWSVTTMDARGTEVPAASPDFSFNPANETVYLHQIEVFRS